MILKSTGYQLEHSVNVVSRLLLMLSFVSFVAAFGVFALPNFGLSLTTAVRTFAILISMAFGFLTTWWSTN